MEIVKLKDAFEEGRNKIADAIRRGDIFIYPTDTIYGIGCNIENVENVKRIYAAKNRPLEKPFSVIIPNKEWINKNCEVSKVNRAFIDQLLPGPYTIILNIKEKNIVSPFGKIGVRIPKCEFTDFIRTTGALFLTTSVNISGEEPIGEISSAPDSIKKIADFAIDAGVMNGHPSRVFDLTTDDIKIIRP